jgi:hypothetical protein
MPRTMLDLREFERAVEAAMYAVGNLHHDGDRIWTKAMWAKIESKMGSHDPDLDDLGGALEALHKATESIFGAYRHLRGIEKRRVSNSAISGISSQKGLAESRNGEEL